MKNLQDWRNLFTFATTYLPHFPLEQCAQGKFFFLYMLYMVNGCPSLVALRHCLATLPMRCICHRAI